MEISDILGITAFLITIVYTCFGLPVQIRKNYMQKSVDGLSLFMNIVLFFTFSSWAVYALNKTPKDWYVFASNFPGVICVIIILLQFVLYYKKDKREKIER